MTKEPCGKRSKVSYESHNYSGWTGTPPIAHYFFGCEWESDSLLGGTMFFSRM